MESQCIVKGCVNNKCISGLCRKHYDQKICGRGIFRDYSLGRRQKDPNEFIIKEDICLIYLYDKQNNKKAEAIIDVEDYDRCSQYKWTGYVSRYTMAVASNSVGQLSNFIMNFTPTPMQVVDHIDGDGLNNRKENLQICSTQQNQLKKRMQKNNTSGYRGVTWYENYNKWLSQIYYDNQRHHLGYFLTKEEAALAYNKKAEELFGKFAVLNKIEGGDYHRIISRGKFCTDVL